MNWKTLIAATALGLVVSTPALAARASATDRPGLLRRARR